MTTFSAEHSQVANRAPAQLPFWAIVLTAGLVALRSGQERSPRQLAEEPSQQRQRRDHGADKRPGPNLDAARGRFARQPSEIPVAGWKDIFIRVYQNIGRDRIIL